MSGEVPHQRLFFALWPSAGVRRRLGAVAWRVQRGRRVPAINLHLTLVFLGRCDAAARVRAVTAANVLAASVPAAFRLHLDRAGVWRRQGIAYLAPSAPPEALGDLAEGLASTLAAHGLPRERRRFRPHVTLARRAGTPPPEPDPVDWPVTGFRLLASEQGPDGVRYRCLGHWPLAGRGVGGEPPL